jgi:hypothetical protein
MRFIGQVRGDARTRARPVTPAAGQRPSGPSSAPASFADTGLVQAGPTARLDAMADDVSAPDPWPHEYDLGSLDRAVMETATMLDRVGAASAAESARHSMQALREIPRWYHPEESAEQLQRALKDMASRAQSLCDLLVAHFPPPDDLVFDPNAEPSRDEYDFGELNRAVVAIADRFEDDGDEMSADRARHLMFTLGDIRSSYTPEVATGHLFLALEAMAMNARWLVEFLERHFGPVD